jgi:hypothetical protein
MYQGGAHRLDALSGMAGSLLGLRLKKNLEHQSTVQPCINPF